MCTLAKYAWMRAPLAGAKRGTRWLNVAESIVLGLGGQAGPEASLASRTGFYDLHTGTAWAAGDGLGGRARGVRPAHAAGGDAARPRRRGAPRRDARRAAWPDSARPDLARPDAAAAPLAGAEGAVLAVGGH